MKINCTNYKKLLLNRRKNFMFINYTQKLDSNRCYCQNYQLELFQWKDYLIQFLIKYYGQDVDKLKKKLKTNWNW